METYRIVRFFQDRQIDSETIATGLTLDEAQAYCRDPETSSTTATNPIAAERTRAYGMWFEGYEAE